MTQEQMLAKVIEQKNEKLHKLDVNGFAEAIGLEKNAQGRYTFGPEHTELAYRYAEQFAQKEGAEKVVIDGVASPAVIASLLHGAHPAEGYVTYMNRDSEGNMSKAETAVLEPMPEGEGSGPDGFTWSKVESPEYTLVQFNLSGPFNVADLDKVIPPEVDPTKPVVISGRGPLYLTHTIAASYRHYKGMPAVGFYQPASKFGPAKTEIGISHNEKYPLGLHFGEPNEIKKAQEDFQEALQQNIHSLAENLSNGEVQTVEVSGNKLIITFNNNERFFVRLADVKQA